MLEKSTNNSQWADRIRNEHVGNRIDGTNERKTRVEHIIGIHVDNEDSQSKSRGKSCGRLRTQFTRRKMGDEQMNKNPKVTDVNRKDMEGRKNRNRHAAI